MHSRSALNLTSKNILLLYCIFVLPSLVFAECTRDQAFNKMMALGRAKQEMLKAGVSDSTTTFLTVDVASVGKILAEENYNLACQKYDAIAAKYNIDLKEKQKGLITMQDIKKDGGKKGGECSQADASKKMMKQMEQLEDRTALGEEDPSVMNRYTNDISRFGDLIYTNPSKYCEELDKLKPKYNLQ